MSIEAFISKTPARGKQRGRRRVLTAHREDILTLAGLGYTHRQIVAYLSAEQSLTVSVPTVSRYIKNQSQQSTPTRAD